MVPHTPPSPSSPFSTLIYSLLPYQFANLSHCSSGLTSVLPSPSAFGALHLTAISYCRSKTLSLRAGHQMQFDLVALSDSYDNAVNRGSVKSDCARWTHYSQQHMITTHVESSPFKGKATTSLNIFRLKWHCDFRQSSFSYFKIDSKPPVL